VIFFVLKFGEFMSFLVSALNEIYRKKDDFLFIGLTGRTGSGCSAVAKLLGSNFDIFQESIYTSLSGNNYRKNKILYKNNGRKLIENNTLVALTLMIAESKSEEKDMMQKVIINLINKNN